jgi:hypothetical protein
MLVRPRAFALVIATLAGAIYTLAGSALAAGPTKSAGFTVATPIPAPPIYVTAPTLRGVGAAPPNATVTAPVLRGTGSR